MTKQTRSLLPALHPEQKDPGGVNGNWHWVNSEGKSLWDIAKSHLKKK
jgi:hypothetical protein